MTLSNCFISLILVIFKDYTIMLFIIKLDDLTKAKVVEMILNKETEHALQSLSEYYKVYPPQIVVGTIKGKRKTVFAVYVQKEKRIYCINSDIFYNPFIVLHEFYHHIRTTGVGIHRGSEKHANMYAKSFVDSYNKIIDQILKQNQFNKTGTNTYSDKVKDG
jgi:hypothetical protein